MTHSTFLALYYWFLVQTDALIIGWLYRFMCLLHHPFMLIADEIEAGASHSIFFCNPLPSTMLPCLLLFDSLCFMDTSPSLTVMSSTFLAAMCSHFSPTTVFSACFFTACYSFL